MTTYKDAGVDIDKANEGLSRIRKHVTSTFNKYTLSDIGSFGGCFNLDIKKYNDPVLVSSVDGVGTKLLIAKDVAPIMTLLLQLTLKPGN